MSGSILLDQVMAYTTTHREALGLFEVREYGGQFSAAEIDFASYNCPAVMYTVLGSRPAGSDAKRLTGKHVRLHRMAGFVVTKGATRDKRMREGLEIAERLAYLLHSWKAPDPKDVQAEIGAPEEEPTIENLYGRAVDKEGQALWLLTWQQAVRPLRAPPELSRVLRIDITDHTRQGVVPAGPPAAGPDNPAGLRVTQDVRFEPLPPT